MQEIVAANWRSLIRPKRVEARKSTDTYGKFVVRPLELHTLRLALVPLDALAHVLDELLLGVDALVEHQLADVAVHVAVAGGGRHFSRVDRNVCKAERPTRA